MTKGHYKYLFIAFLILNGFLLFKFYSYDQGTGESTNHEMGSEVLQPGRLHISNLKGGFDSVTEKNLMKLFIFFPDEYCGACVDISLPYLRQLHKKFPKKLVIGNPSTRYNLNSLITQAARDDSTIKEIIVNHKLVSNLRAPVLILGMNDGTVLLYHDFFKEKSNTSAFFGKVNQLLTLTS